jgi:hypothetical protein
MKGLGVVTWLSSVGDVIVGGSCHFTVAMDGAVSNITTSRAVTRSER